MSDEKPLIPIFLEGMEWRKKKISDFSSDEWLWPKKDQGAYKGPFSDWSGSHSRKYFTHLKNKRTVITAGANLGVYVREYARLFEQVYAFEPSWKNFYCMSYNTPYPNVHKFQIALSDSEGLTRVEDSNDSNVGTHTIISSANENERHVPVMKLDSFPFKNVDLIQLDVEGHEFRIVKGAKHIISRDKPVVVAENHSRELEEFLFPMGYQLVHRSVSDRVYAIPK